MKVLIAVHHFPPRFTGGAEWRAHRTASSLIRRGHSVQVVAVEHIDRGPEQGLEWEQEEFEGVPVRRLSFRQLAVPDRIRFEYDNPWIGEHLHRMMQEERPDLYHQISGYMISASGLRAAHELQIPTVVTLTDFWYLCPRTHMLRSNDEVSTLPIDPVRCARCLGEEHRRYRIPGRLLPGLMDIYWRGQKDQVEAIRSRQAFLFQTLNQINAIISPSRFLRKMYVEAGVDPGRIIFSRQGRDFSQLDPAVLKKAPSPVLRIGYLGQIAPNKGVHLLFEAVQKLADVPLTVRAFGDLTKFPDYAARLQALAAQDRRIELAGPYQSRELSGVLQELDLVVVPSILYENSPNVIIEAFAHRTPVVASNFGGMAELVRHGEDGLLFELGSVEDLALQIRRLVDEPGLLGRLAAGIQPIKGVAEEMDELEEIYRKAARREPTAQENLPV